MTIKKDNKMPSIETLRKYYPATTRTDQELLDCAEWVRVYSNKAHISPDNKILAGIIAIDDDRAKAKKASLAEQIETNHYENERM